MKFESRSDLKDDVYMQQALQAARMSKDKNTQVGCVIIAQDGSPVSQGYNGTVSGYPDHAVPHSRENEELCYRENGELRRFEANKYPFMCHAEDNAIFFAERSGRYELLRGATLYVTGFPCEECAKRISRCGIRRVVVREPEAVDSTSMLSSASDARHLAKFHLALGGVYLVVDGRPVHLEVELHRQEPARPPAEIRWS